MAFALAVLAPAAAWAGSAPAPGRDVAAKVAAGEVCPLSTPVFKARLDAGHYAARVGRTAHIRVRLTPPRVPEGFFVTCIIDALSTPPGARPDILTGFPVSDVTPRAPGHYRLHVSVNLIAKSSCGGVKAVTLLDREVTLDAK